jgi:hypothetical protein
MNAFPGLYEVPVIMFLPNSVIMTANSASYLHIGPSETGGFPVNITVRNCRQTGNDAGSW